MKNRENVYNDLTQLCSGSPSRRYLKELSETSKLSMKNRENVYNNLTQLCSGSSSRRYLKELSETSKRSMKNRENVYHNFHSTVQRELIEALPQGLQRELVRHFYGRQVLKEPCKEA